MYYLCSIKITTLDGNIVEEHYLVSERTVFDASLRVAIRAAHLGFMVDIEHIKTRIYPDVAVDVLAEHMGDGIVQLTDSVFQTYHAQIISRRAHTCSPG